MVCDGDALLAVSGTAGHLSLLDPEEPILQELPHNAAHHGVRVFHVVYPDSEILKDHQPHGALDSDGPDRQ